MTVHATDGRWWGSWQGSGSRAGQGCTDLATLVGTHAQPMHMRDLCCCRGPWILTGIRLIRFPVCPWALLRWHLVLVGLTFGPATGIRVAPGHLFHSPKLSHRQGALCSQCQFSNQHLKRTAVGTTTSAVDVVVAVAATATTLTPAVVHVVGARPLQGRQCWWRYLGS